METILKKIKNWSVGQNLAEIWEVEIAKSVFTVMASI